MSTDSMLFLLCCTVRNQAEMFRAKTGVVLSGRLSRPPGFVEFVAVCAPALPIKCTLFSMWFRRRTVLWASTRSAHHMTVWWYVFCRILRGSLCSNVDGERSYFLCTLMANKLVCNDVFLTCFPPCDVWFYARFAVPVCSLFRGRFWCHFDVILWVKFLLFRRLFVSFSEPLPTYYRVRNKRHLSAHFMMCSTK